MVVAVGGHARKIGKTAVVEGLIRELPDRRWTAVKITPHGHPFALSEECEPGDTDSGRFLAAGAARAFWLRTPAGQLARAADALRQLIDRSENVILESSSFVDLIKPDVFLMVLDFSRADCKASSRRFVARADAFLVIDRGIPAPPWENLLRGLWDTKPRFLVKPPAYVTPAVADFVSLRLSSPLPRP